jgi:hypothetical protein
VPVDLSANGRASKRDRALADAQAEASQLRDQLDCTHTELALAHDALNSIVERKGRGALKLASKVLGLR